MAGSLQRVACIALLLMPLGHAADECPVARIVEPAEPVISESRPTFAWEPVPGVQQYRLRLQSRVPEGELLVAIDTLVPGTRFAPPRPLTSKHAVVKVVVSAPCESPPALDSGLRLLIDTGLGCRISHPTHDDATDTWEWPASPGASSYEVIRYAMPRGELMERQDVPAPVPLRIEGSDIVAVRARCASGYSDWVFAP
jgi:hypothetical protein